ncbi:MAG: tetraacyldisaccharide 4'-kinase [Crocinitomicaceae bacterium]
MKWLRFIFIPFGIVFALITFLRNKFYDWEIFKSSKFSIPIIGIGNLSVGGTGKTPHTAYLIELLKKDFNLFTLSRGYGRKKRGFIIANENSTANDIGDEPLLYQKRYGAEIGVAVESNRVLGVIEICSKHPETNLILLDDAYQHRSIQPGLNILITTYSKSFYKDYILPVGDLREWRSGKTRADIIVVSKCPDISEKEKEQIIEKINPRAEQHVFFSSIKYLSQRSFDAPLNQMNLEGRPIILVTAIANASYLREYLEKSSRILSHFEFNDHYDFKATDITEVHNLFDKFVSEDPVIVTTEKDAMRLYREDLLEEMKNYPWVVQEIGIELDREVEFNELVMSYVEKNS